MGQLQTSDVEIRTKDGVCDAFVAYPDGNGPFPALLFYMDGFGVRPQLREMAQRMAKLGYFVLLPNLFYRVRRAPVIDVHFPLSKEDMPAAVEKLRALFTTFDPELAMRDANAFLDFLAKQKEVRSGPIGITGYCMGGRLSILTATRFPDRVAVAASFHAGGLVTDAPDSPHRGLGRIKAEIYVAHAENDQNMTPAQIASFSEAMKEAKVHGNATLYKGAAHGFTMADLPAYNAEASDKHWRMLYDLLARGLR
jgi:carboxymethylenebutenolidase